MAARRSRPQASLGARLGRSASPPSPSSIASGACISSGITTRTAGTPRPSRPAPRGGARRARSRSSRTDRRRRPNDVSQEEQRHDDGENVFYRSKPLTPPAERTRPPSPCRCGSEGEKPTDGSPRPPTPAVGRRRARDCRQAWSEATSTAFLARAKEGPGFSFRAR